MQSGSGAGMIGQYSKSGSDSNSGTGSGVVNH